MNSSLLAAAESEVELIAGAMYAPEVCVEIMDRVTPDHFADPVHGRVWGAIVQLVRSGRHPHPPLIRDQLGEDPGFDGWGGMPTLLDLCDRAAVTGLRDHADAVVDRSARRAIVDLTKDVQAKASDFAAGSAEALIAELEQGAGEIAHSNTGADRWLAAAEMITGAIERAQTRKGIIEFPAGIRSLDRFTGGLHRGEMTILGARTGMGKSTGAQVYARATASGGRGTLFLSLEMDADPMALRLACDMAFDRRAVTYSGVTTNPTLESAFRGELQPFQWEQLRETAEVVRRWPIKFDTRPGLTIIQIEALCRRQFRKWERAGIEPGLVVIDHIGKVAPTRDRRGDRRLEIADASDGAMQMAKRLEVPVLALCQLNRGVESHGRADKKPVLADLRQAGELEEDARQVLFLFRPEYYLRDAPEGETAAERVERETKRRDAANKMYWIVGKNSHGPLGEVLTFCNMACSAVRDWDE